MADEPSGAADHNMPDNNMLTAIPPHNTISGIK